MKDSKNIEKGILLAQRMRWDRLRFWRNSKEPNEIRHRLIGVELKLLRRGKKQWEELNQKTI